LPEKQDISGLPFRFHRLWTVFKRYLFCLIIRNASFWLFSMTSGSLPICLLKVRVQRTQVATSSGEVMAALSIPYPIMTLSCSHEETWQ
jgi:hypothetical protein